MTSPSVAGPILAGKTVVLTRSPDRAAAMLAALAEQGALPALFPVIDFEVPADTDALDGAVLALHAGRFDWLMISSITTVRSLAARGAALDLRLDQLVPEGTRVAAVGPAVSRALESEGIRVDLVPDGEQSAHGLLQSWAAATAAGSQRSPSILLPQADIAAPLLRDGLREHGAEVLAVDAYRTVNYPAAAERRLVQPPSMTGPVNGGGTAVDSGRSGPDDAADYSAAADGRTASPGRTEGSAGAEHPGSAAVPLILSSADFLLRQLEGGVDAVVLTSPSAARRLSQEAGPLLPSVKVVAIGRPTAAEAAAVGLTIAAVAAEPTPAGVVESLKHAFADGDSSADSSADKERRLSASGQPPERSDDRTEETQ